MDNRTSKNFASLARGTSENLKIFLPLIVLYEGYIRDLHFIFPMSQIEDVTLSTFEKLSI